MNVMARFPIWAGVLVLGLILSFGLAHAFTPPTVSPGTGGGSLQLDSSGNIGVGTSSSTPVSTFNSTSTESGPTTHGKIFMVASSTNPGIGLKNLTSNNTYLWSSRNFGNLQLYRESGPPNNYPGLVVIDINPLGDVAIGTSTQSSGAPYRFKVGGNALITGSISGNLTGSVLADNVGSGVFGDLVSGTNYAFPGSLGVGTSSEVGLPTRGLLVTGTTTLATVAGNVGIGTTAPGYKLHVLTGDNNPAFVIGKSISEQYLFQRSGSTGFLQFNGTQQTYSGFQFLTYPTGGSANSVVMTVLNSGSVGIGTTAPTTTLTVAGDITALGGDVLFGDNGNSNREFITSFDGGIAGINGVGVFGFFADGSLGTVATSPSAGLSASGIYSSGNVGIKTTNPSSTLHIVGSTTITDDLYLTNNKSIRLDNAANTTLLVGNYNTGSFTYGAGQTASLAVEGDVKGNRLCFGDADCQTSWSGIVASGGGNYWVNVGSNLYPSSTSWNVGIGTTTPAAKLHVDGSVYLNSGGSYWIGSLSDSGNRMRFHLSGANGYIDYYSSLQFRTGAATSAAKVVFDSSGNVGIGTTTPQQALHVQGKILISSSGSGFPSLGNIITDEPSKFSTLTTQVGSSGWMQIVSDSGALGISTGGTLDATRLVTFQSGGNVGIGTTTPATALNVIGLVRSTDATQAYTPPLTNTDLTPKKYVDDNFAPIGGSSGIWINSGSNLYASSTSWNVGIGTTNPQSHKLAVSGNSANTVVGAATSTALEIRNEYATTFNALSELQFSVGAGGSPIGVVSGKYTTWNATNGVGGDLLFSTKNAAVDSAPQERLRIRYDGNVGIGTTAPGVALSVVGEILSTNNISVQSTTNSNFKLIESGDSGFQIQYDGDGSNNLNIQSGTSGTFTDKLSIERDTGNIGIGTTSPSKTLSIKSSTAGAAEASIWSSANGAIFSVTGGTTSNNIYLESAPAGIVNIISTDSSAGVLQVYSGSAYSIKLAGNGNSYLNGGNVGIGVTDPGAAKLRVEGDTIVNGNINQLVATSYNYLVAPTSIGSASSPGTNALYVNGFSRFDTGVRIESTSGGGGWVYYPNVVSYEANNTIPGAIILNTNINRNSNEMFKMRVIGYGYGSSTNIDFTVVGYAYFGQIGSVDGLAGAIVNYSVVDNGNDGLTKRVGVNSAGKVAISVGDISSSFYYYRMAADYWSTRNAVDASSGWSFSTSTVAGFGWLDNKTLSPAITQFTDGAVSIGTTTDTAYKLYVNGTSLFNGQLNITAGQQLTWSATNANNKIDLAGGDLTGVDKISAATVDPLYEIEGTKYSTYAPSIAGGVKEEYIGQAKLKKYTGQFYEYILDLEKEKKGSDLWVWFKAVDFSKDSVQATITPIGEPVSVAYEIKDNSIIFRGSSATEFSFRLTGKRFDWRDHPTYAKDQQESPNLIIK